MNVLLLYHLIPVNSYARCCSVQGRLQIVLLCLWYVEPVAIGACFVLHFAVCAEEAGLQEEKKTTKNAIPFSDWSGRYIFLVGN